MLQEVEKIFFELLRFEVLETELSDGVKSLITPSVLPTLFMLSKRHDLAHLIGDALEKHGLLPENSKIKERFLNEKNVAIYRLAQLSYEYERVCGVLEELKVKYIPLKGIVIRKLYPQNCLRTSADVDILIDKNSLKEVIKTLTEKLNYTYETTDAYNAIVVSPNGVHVELHFDLITKYDSEVSNKILSEVWEHSKQLKNSYKHLMNDDYFYYYHLAHMARHFIDGGCGVKPFIDLWLLNNKICFNKEDRNELLIKGELLQFEKACNLLSKIWLEGLEHSNETLALQNYLLKGGVFGSSDNKILINQGKKGGRFKYVTSRIFMPLEKMQHRYAVLKRHKWLYPFFVIVRCFEVLFKGDSTRIKNELKTSAQITGAEQEKTQDLLNYLGLN